MNLKSKFEFKKNLPEKKINNSSIFTEENSSTIQTNRLNSFNQSNTYRSQNVSDMKYLNSNIFEKNRNKNLWIKNPDLSLNNKNQNNNKLYLTETNDEKTPIFKYNSKRNTSQTIELNSNYRLINRNFMFKDSLPVLKCYYHRKEKYPDIFTCGNFSMEPKLLNELYYKQNKSREEMEYEYINNLGKVNNNRRMVKPLKQSARDYIDKSNKINLLNRYIRLKKDALDNYNENMKTQLKGLDTTISQIKTYKENLENNFFTRYNKDLRDFNKQILEGKLYLDNQEKKLVNLIREVGELTQEITKKQKIIKRYDKWLSFQILLKEGSEPKIKNIKEYLDKKYGNKPIFDNYDDFYIGFREREDRNLRLIKRREKSMMEFDDLKKEYNDLKNYIKKNNNEIDSDIKLKEKKLFLLKYKNKELNSIKNNLDQIHNKKKNKNSTSLKKYKTTLEYIMQKDKKKDIDYENDLQLNSLGIYVYDLENAKNIFQFITCIYNTILKNEIKGNELPNYVIYKIKNPNLTKEEKTLLKLKIIEMTINYLIATKNKIKNDKIYGQIFKETKKEIDLYKKLRTAKIHKEKESKKFSEFLIEMEEKNKKIYFIPYKKVDNYSGYLSKKKRSTSNKEK